MKYLPGQYVRVCEKYAGEVRTTVGIVAADPHPFWTGYVAVLWPGPRGDYKRAYPVDRKALVLV